VLTSLLIGFIVASGILAVVTFVVYVRARMKEQEQRERLFLRVHYIALFTVLLLGMVLLFYMVETSD
jgi:Tfp pilus assembly protein PilN